MKNKNSKNQLNKINDQYFNNVGTITDSTRGIL